MGHYYPWASPWAIGQLTLSQLGMYLSRIPTLELRRHYSTAKLEWLVDSFLHQGKGRYRTPSDALPWFAEQVASIYTHSEALGLQLAIRKGWIKQPEWDELEMSGMGLVEYERALRG